MVDELTPEQMREYGTNASHYLWEHLGTELCPDDWSLDKRTAFIAGFEIGLHFGMQDQAAALGIAMTINAEVHEGQTEAAHAARDLRKQIEQWGAEAHLLFSPLHDREEV